MDAASPPPDPTGPHADLMALRERLRAARAERGACPPWEELRDDLLPGGAQRNGRAERAAHLDLCPYCAAHVEEWRRSRDRTADTLGAIEKGVARGVVGGAKKLAELAARPLVAPEPTTPGVAPPAPRPVPPPAAAPGPAPPVPSPPPPPAPSSGVLPTYIVRATPAPPPSSASLPRPPLPRAPGAPPGPRSAHPAPLRLLVVECRDESEVPASVFLCAQVIEAEVACVARVEELGGDPDLDAVCGVVFAGDRPSAEWPEAVRRARDLAPGRPIVVLAPAGSAPPAGARRALGARLLAVTDSPERLLVALEG